MERIVIEVDEKLAKAWRGASAISRKAFSNRINETLANELIENTTNDYQNFLEKLRLEMTQKGLTQAELDNILSNE